MLRGDAGSTDKDEEGGRELQLPELNVCVGPFLDDDAAAPLVRELEWLYLPPEYEANPNRRYPVIYWLHGLNGDSRQAINHGWTPRLDAAIRN